MSKVEPMLLPERKLVQEPEVDSMLGMEFKSGLMLVVELKSGLDPEVVLLQAPGLKPGLMALLKSGLVLELESVLIPELEFVPEPAALSEWTRNFGPGVNAAFDPDPQNCNYRKNTVQCTALQPDPRH